MVSGKVIYVVSGELKYTPNLNKCSIKPLGIFWAYTDLPQLNHYLEIWGGRPPEQNINFMR